MSATGALPVRVLWGQAAGNWLAVARRVNPGSSCSAKTNTPWVEPRGYLGDPALVGLQA